MWKYLKDRVKKITTRVTELNKKEYIILAILSVLLIMAITLTLITESEYGMALLFSECLLYVILLYVLLKRNKVLFNPMYLFSLYYLTIPFTVWYLVSTNFETNLYVNSTTYHSDFTALFSLSIFYYLIGFIFTLIGYYLIKPKENHFEIKYEDKRKISDIALKIVIVLFYSAGILNFSINVMHFSNGNVFDYFANMSRRAIEFNEWGTTIGYTFMEISVFLWLYYLLRDKKNFSISFIISTFIYILVKASGGRIFGTLSVIAVIIGVYYFSELSKKKKIDNKKYLLVASIIILASVFMYFFRLMSNYIEIGKVDNVLDGFKLFFHQIGYYAVDRGNVPNIAIMPKIIDSWDSDIGYLCGSSFLTFIFSFVNIGIPHTKFMTSVMIKNTWFSQVEGGFLPPTGVGEMYANFGPVGVFIGMLLFGIFIAFLYKFMVKKGNFFVTLVSIKIIVLFIMIYPKVDSSNFSLWFILPYIAVYLGLLILTKVINHVFNIARRKKDV